MADSPAQAPPRAEQKEIKNEASDQLDLPPALEARASDCETTAEWQSLGTLRLQMADTGTASVAPMSAELYAAKFTQAAEEEKKNHSKGLPAFPGSTLPPQAQENAMAAIRVLQDPHVAQLLDRAASGNLTVTELDYDGNHAPSILHPLCDARGGSLLKRFSRLPPLASQSVYKANLLYILFTYSANPT